MNSTQAHLSQTSFDAFCQQVLNGASFCAENQILALADELHDIIRSRRMARWLEASETRSFDPATEAAEAFGA